MKIIILPLLLLILIVGYSWGDDLDLRIAQANKSADSLRVVANKLASQKVATRIDSLFQVDSTLAADKVRVVGGGIDSMWVKIAIDKFSPLDQKIVKAELKGADLYFQATSSPDTLYMRRDRAEKARSVISAALKE